MKGIQHVTNKCKHVKPDINSACSIHSVKHPVSTRPENLYSHMIRDTPFVFDSLQIKGFAEENFSKWIYPKKDFMTAFQLFLFHILHRLH